MSDGCPGDSLTGPDKNVEVGVDLGRTGGTGTVGRRGGSDATPVCVPGTRWTEVGCRTT